MDDSKVLVNIDRFANTTAATIPLGLVDAGRAKEIAQGRSCAADCRGRGFTTGAVLMRWAY